MADARIMANEAYDPPGSLSGLATQDDVIRRIFEIIGAGSRAVVDVGIGDSWHDGPVHRELPLEGWTVLGIERKKASADDLRRIYGADAVIEHRALNFPDDADVLDRMIGEHLPDTRVDLLGIRLRGPDWQAWDHLSHRPRVVAVLFNPSIPAVVEYVQEDGPGVNKGASLLALKILGEARGYDLAHVGRLAVFVDKVEAASLDLGDTSLARLWDGGAWQTRMMVGMDGTLVVGGNNRLFWNRLGEGLTTFEQEDLQPLPKSFRRMEW